MTDAENARLTASRCQALRSAQENGRNGYPHKFSVTSSLDRFLESGSLLEISEDSVNSFSLAGRVSSINQINETIRFYDIRSESRTVKVLVDSSFFPNYCVTENIELEDIIGVTGKPVNLPTYGLCLQSTDIILLSPCLKLSSFTKDHSGSFYLKLLTDENFKKSYLMRTRVNMFIRSYLDQLRFHEVETPMMNTVAGGASAQPLHTYHNDLGTNMYLRVSPELFLKQLVIGGIERVYEVGRSFRYENMTHVKEFTMIEFYMAYDDHNDIKRTTEQLLSNLIYCMFGSHIIHCHPDDEDGIDFSKQFTSIDIIQELETACGALPSPETYNKPESQLFFDNLSVNFNVPCAEPRTTARLFKALVAHFIEKKCVNPTFICNHPQIISPLAKDDRSKPGLTERIELCINGVIICNAYTELNDPFIQRERFAHETEKRNAGDAEAQMSDEEYCEALEYGLPPTAGCGINIDSLMELLKDATARITETSRLARTF